MTATTPLDLFGLHRTRALALARVLCRRLPRHVPADEVEQAALLGLWDAAKRYQPGKPFWAYARHRVAGAMRDHLRQGVARKKKRPRFGSWRLPERQPAQFSQVVRGEKCCRRWAEEVGGADRHDHVREVELRDLVEHALGCLSERDRAIFTGRYIEGWLGSELAERLGLSLSGVHCVLAGKANDTLLRLRARLAGAVG